MSKLFSLKAFLFVLVFLQSTVEAQVIFNSQLDMPGATLYNLEVLPDGDLFMSGAHGDSLLLMRSTALGEVVWQRVYPDIGRQSWFYAYQLPKLWLTTDGMVSLIATGTSGGLYIFDPANGNEVFSAGALGASSVAWVSPDSLLYIRGASENTELVLGHRSGGESWALSAPTPTSGGSITFHEVLETSLGEIIVIGIHSFSIPPFTGSQVWLGHYSSAGVLVDSMSTGSLLPTTRIMGLDRTFDGGFFALAQGSTAEPLWIKGEPNGEVTSVIDWRTDVVPGQPWVVFCEAIKAIALPQGGYRTSGVLFEGALGFDHDRTVFDMDTNGTITCIRELGNDSTVADPIGDFGMDATGFTYVCGGSPLYPSFAPNSSWTGIDELCDLPTRVEQHGAKNEIEVFPQPSTGIFRISMKDVAQRNFTTVIRDTNGNVVHEQKHRSGVVVVDLTDRPNGIYHCQILEEVGAYRTIPLLKVE